MEGKRNSVATTDTGWFYVVAGDCHMISVSQLKNVIASHTQAIYSSVVNPRKGMPFKYPFYYLDWNIEIGNSCASSSVFSALKISNKKCQNLERNAQYSGAHINVLLSL